MANYTIQQTVDLKKAARVVVFPEALMLPGDDKGHVLEITVMNGSAAADLSGYTAAGYFERVGGTIVPRKGSVSGNVVRVTLNRACYAFPGQLRAVVRLTSDTNKVLTLADDLFQVGKGLGNEIIDEDLLPSVDVLLAQIERMEQATEEAKAAAKLSMRFQGTVYQGKFAAFSDITELGYYRFNSEMIADYPDKPDGLLGGGVIYNFTVDGGSRYQIIQSFEKMWARNITSTGTVQAWFWVAGEKNSDYMVYRGQLTAENYPINAFSKITETGFYHFTASMVEAYKDKPDRLLGSGVIYNFTVTGGSRFQIIQSFEKMWARNITSAGTVQEWFWVAGEGNSDSMVYRGQLTAENYPINAFSKITETGFYHFTASMVEAYRDKPEELLGSGVLYNFTVTGGSQFQIIQSYEKMWARNITSGGTVQEWYWITRKEQSLPTVWYAIGDSITRGIWTDIGDSEGKGPTVYNYVYWVSRINSYTAHNLGDSGMGYLAKGKESGGSVKGIVDSNDFADADLITIALGTNDWGSEIGSVGDKAGAATICGALKYAIERIMEKRPACKLVVITPFNRARGGGSIETNWAMGCDKNGKGTMQDITDAIISVCKCYGVQYIDMSMNSPVNRQNLYTLLGDGLHPTQDGYKLIGRCLAKQLPM